MKKITIKIESCRTTIDVNFNRKIKANEQNSATI